MPLVASYPASTLWSDLATLKMPMGNVPWEALSVKSLMIIVNSKDSPAEETP